MKPSAMSDPCELPGAELFQNRIGVFAHDFLRCTLFIAETGGKGQAYTQKFYSTLASASTLLEDFLDYHGAKNNKNWYFFRELVATMRHIGLASNFQKHISNRILHYDLPESSEFEAEGVQALHVSSPSFTGDILVASNEWCRPSGNPKNMPGGITIYDITQPTGIKVLVDGFGDFDLHGNRANESHSAIAWDAGDRVYAALIETLDDAVGQLLRKLDALDLAQKTIVIFTSDNGGLSVPEGPHQIVTHNGPYRAGKGFLYEGGLRVPLIVRWPGKIPAGKVIHHPTVNTDWTPTLLELCGLPVPEGLDGVSIAGVLTDGKEPGKRMIFFHFPHYSNQGGRPGGAVRDGQWKLIEHYEDGQIELFDLDKDIGETTNVASQHPQVAERLRAALADWRRAIGAQQNAPNPDFDPLAHRALYIDIDPSRFNASIAGQQQVDRMQQWRKAMNAATAARTKPKP